MKIVREHNGEIDPRGSIYLPSDLSNKERSLILKHLRRFQRQNPELKRDYILVDILNGDLNIKFFKYNEVEKICLESGYRLTPYDVVMHLMRVQNGFKY